MDLRHMRYFLAVADELHFRKAAELLHVSQPSLSEQIHELERELGVKLFERSTRSVRLSPAGEILMHRARKILQGIDEAVAETKQVAKGLSGRLTISFVSTALVGKLPQALRLFSSAMPGVEIGLEEIDPGEQIEHILRGTSDVGFMHGVIDDPHLDSAIVQKDRLVAALPDRYAANKSIDLKVLSEETLILPQDFSSYGFSSHVQRAFELAGVRPRHVLHTRLIIVGLYLVAAGMGISLVPASFETIQVSGVVYVPLASQSSAIELIAVWRRDSESKLLRKFLKHFGSNPGQR